jgi:hypothetical protein
MSVKLFADRTPPLLLDGHIVHFSKEYSTGEVVIYGDKYYRVSNPQQVKFVRYYIIPDADYVDVTLSNAASGTENIYPYQANELNEILIGIEGDSVLMYPIMPSPDRYMQELGYTGMSPSVGDTTKMYLGCLTEVDSPVKEKKFRVCFVKDEVPMVLRLYIDSGEAYEKVMLHFLVNRCSLQHLTVPTEDQKKVARRILRYSEIKKRGGV